MSINFRTLTLVLISFDSHMILMRIENQKTTISNKVRAIEQIYVLDPVK